MASTRITAAKLALNSTDTPSEAFEMYCALEGFELDEFDAWLTALEPCGAKVALTNRRAEAMRGVLNDNIDAALRHLEYMTLRWKAIRREEFLLPIALKDKERRDARSRAASVPRKLSEDGPMLILNGYIERDKRGDTYGAIKELARAFGVSTKRVGEIVAPYKAEKKNQK